MRILKKLCAAFAAVTVLASCITVSVSAKTFTDVTAEAKYSLAVDVLSNLNIINGYEDGSFKPSANVTRAEFTAMLMRTRGLEGVGSSSLEDPPFPDVTSSDVSWAIGNIRTAHSKGIINGYDDGTFKPNNNVLYEEAVKMIVCAMGYADFQPEGNEWYSKYINSANYMGILKNAEGSIGTYATRSCIAQLLYDCLEVKLAESNQITDKTILNNDLQIIKNTGKISSNSVTSLTSPDVTTRDGEIKIYAKDADKTEYETYTYKTDNAKQYENMLGQEVTFYYTYDRNSDTRTIKFISLAKGTRLQLKASDIENESCTNNSIKYYKDSSSSATATAAIDSNSIVIYNGKLYGNTDTDSRFDVSMLPVIGNVELLDSDSSGTYDVIFIEKYEPYVVSTVTRSTYTIVDDVTKSASSSNRTVVLDVDNVDGEMKIVDKDGKNVAFSNISKWDVVCVKRSNPNSGTLLTTAVVVDTKDAVTGKITSIKKGDSITVNGNTYKYSPAAPWMNSSSDASDLKEPSLSDSGTFYLDINNEVIAYDKTETASNQMYGYIMGAGYDDGGVNDETLQLNILTQSGTKVIYDAYDKTKLNGETYKNLEELYNELANAAIYQNTDEGSTNTSHTQVIKFTTKTYQGKTVLDEILTAENINSGREVTSDSLTMLSTVNASTALKYTSSNKQLTGNGVTINLSGATIFSVPSARNKTSDYRKGSTSDFKNGNMYYVEVFDVAASRAAKVVVLYGADATKEVDAETPAYVVEEVTSMENPDHDNDVMVKVNGMNGKSKFEVWASPDCESIISDLKKGDIVRFGTDNDGFATLKNDDILWRSGMKPYYETDDTTPADVNEYDSDFKVIYGSVFSADSDYIVVAPEFIGTDEYSGNADELSIMTSSFSGARILSYDTENSEIEFTDMSNDGIEDVAASLDVYNGDTEPSEVFVYMAKGKVKLFVIIE